MKSTAYQKQMDALHVPKKKADETLRLMLEENRRLRQKEAEKAEKGAKKSRTRITVMAFAAACVLALAVGIGSIGGGSAYTSVKISGLPTAAVVRGDEEQTLSFRAAFGREAASLFPGWTVEEESAVRLTGNGETLNEAKLTLTKGETRLSAGVTDYEPPLLTQLKKSAKPLANQVYLAKDTDSAALYAVYETEGLYVVLSSADMAEQAFRQLAEGMR